MNSVLHGDVIWQHSRVGRSWIFYRRSIALSHWGGYWHLFNSVLYHLKASLFNFVHGKHVWCYCNKIQPQFLCNKFKTETHILEVCWSCKSNREKQNIISSYNLTDLMIWAAIHQLNSISYHVEDKWTCLGLEFFTYVSNDNALCLSWIFDLSLIFELSQKKEECPQCTVVKGVFYLSSSARCHVWNITARSSWQIFCSLFHIEPFIQWGTQMI